MPYDLSSKHFEEGSRYPKADREGPHQIPQPESRAHQLLLGEVEQLRVQERRSEEAQEDEPGEHAVLHLLGVWDARRARVRKRTAQTAVRSLLQVTLIPAGWCQTVWDARGHHFQRQEEAALEAVTPRDLKRFSTAGW